MSRAGGRSHENGLRYQEDCKSGEVQRLLDLDYRLADLAKRYELSESTVRRWISIFDLQVSPWFYRTKGADRVSLDVIHSPARDLAMSNRW